MVVLQLD